MDLEQVVEIHLSRVGNVTISTSNIDMKRSLRLTHTLLLSIWIGREARRITKTSNTAWCVYRRWRCEITIHVVFLSVRCPYRRSCVLWCSCDSVWWKCATDDVLRWLLTKKRNFNGISSNYAVSMKTACTGTFNFFVWTHTKYVWSLVH